MTVSVPPKRFVFTHHKCASAWSTTLFAELAARTGLTFSFHDSFNQMRPDNPATREVVGIELGQGCASDIVYDANARPHSLDTLAELCDGNFLAVHIVRDPRDVLVSAYFSHRNVHPTDKWPALEAQRARLLELDEESGLIDEIDFASFCLEGLGGWDYGHPRVLTVRYEDLFGPHDPRRTVELMLGWLRLDVPSSVIDDVLDGLSFEKLSGGRTRGTESQQHHYRKGVAGDWRNHFTPAVERAFKDRYGEALVAAGYEDDLHW